MGTDKGSLTFENDTWAQSAFNKLASLNIPVVLSVNELQLQSYPALFDVSLLIADDPSIGIKGPLGGVLNIHKRYNEEDLFILACDMPFMEIDILQQLLELYLEHQDHYDAFVFTNGNEPEPLCAIYTAGGLEQTLQLYHTNELKKHSMKFMLDHLDTFSLPIPEDQKKCFLNVNSHAALNGL
jgi:molybdopterin-guanine dinucleotide biosynthesis protein A